MPIPAPGQVAVPSIPDSYQPGSADYKQGEVSPTHRLSVYDPITGAYINLDGGAAASISVLYQILVELRINNALMQQLVSTAQAGTDDVQNIRADQSVAEPLFTQTR